MEVNGKGWRTELEMHPEQVCLLMIRSAMVFLLWLRTFF